MFRLLKVLVLITVFAVSVVVFSSVIGQDSEPVYLPIILDREPGETMPIPELEPGRIVTSEIIGVREDGTGNFRTRCLESHENFDDPLVAPGQPGAAHHHIFFGNPATDAYTTVESLQRTEETTCEGRTLNRSAYWVPAMYDQNGERLVYEDPLFYYKSGFHVPADLIKPFPLGLQMIAGHAHAKQPQGVEAVKYRCASWEAFGPQFDPGDPQDHLPYLPDCEVGDLVEMRIVFPQCWDGINLSSTDHQSHMAYPNPATPPYVGTGSCPSSHPVALPEISYNFDFYVTEDTGTPSSWRLASDTYESGPGGYSTHADWMNGWNPDIMKVIVENCINKSLECGVGLLGDGTRLEPLE